MTRLEIQNKLVEIMCQTCGKKVADFNITEDTDLIDDLHLDSISLLMMAISIERELGVELSTVDMSKSTKLRDFITLIENNGK